MNSFEICPVCFICIATVLVQIFVLSCLDYFVLILMLTVSSVSLIMQLMFDTSCPPVPPLPLGFMWPVGLCLWILSAEHSLWT